MYKKLLLIFLAAAMAVPTLLRAQDISMGTIEWYSDQDPDAQGGLKGTVVNRKGRTPIANAVISLYQNGVLLLKATTGSEGYFYIDGLPNGNYTLRVVADDFADGEVFATVEGGYVKDLIFVSMVAQQLTSDFDASSFAEFDLDDSGYSDSPTLLYGNDVYSSVAGYDFSTVRFKNRGYNSETQDVYVSGIRLNDAITGYSPYSLWTGLNEATRTKETSIGLDPTDYAFGGFNGITNIPLSASSVRQGFRVSVLTNSALYRLRFMASYAHPFDDKGWSYAFNVSVRLGGNDWVEGVYYRNFAYYAAVEKKFSESHKLGLTVFGTPGQRGAQNASTQEVYDLVGSNTYNSNWGYQNGKMRNARVRKTHEPVAVLKYTFTPNNDLEASATLVYRTGKNAYTALDWYDSQDPRPDYYRYLPSYFYMDDPDYGRTELNKYGWATEAWENNVNDVQHIQWDRIYGINSANLVNGLARSKYVLQQRRVDQNDVNANASIKWRASNLFTLTGGVTYKWNRTEAFQTIDDLLGGDYYVDIDQYAERDYGSDAAKMQNDLDYYLAHGTSQNVVKGDKYGYDYYANVRNVDAWVTGTFNFSGFKIFVSAKGGYDRIWRDGLNRKGLFAGLDDNGNEIISPDTGDVLTTYDSNGNVITSKGKSEILNFWTYAAKAGISKYFIGGHSVYANVGYFNDAPTFNQSFVSPRTRNSVIPNISTTKTFSADINYAYNNNGYSVRVTGFYTTIKDQTDVMSFYDDSQNSYTNFAMSGINERHVGVEFGAKVPLPVTGLSLQGVLSWGNYVYTSNPHMTQTVDNSNEVVFDNELVPYWKSHPVYSKDADGNYLTDANGDYIVEKYQKHYVPSTPQLAASIGLNWRSRSYWFLSAELNYFDFAYLDMNPLYRTDMAVSGPDGYSTPAEVEYMAAQERFDPVFLLNASVGKSWYIHYKYNFGFSLSVNNILNNKAIKTGGYEQTRLITSDSGERYYKFDPKYFYTSGINYMLNLYFKF